VVRLRAYLRVLVASWLVLQAVSLSAFVPRDCCVGHSAPVTKEKSCHEDATAVQCPLKGADAQQCPMHHGQTGSDQGAVPDQHDTATMTHHGDHAAPAEQPADDSCSMRGLCNGPMEALFAVLATHGVMPESFVMRLSVPVSAAPPAARVHLVSRLATPDSPPPRA
jgi:hypothetical protein